MQAITVAIGPAGVQYFGQTLLASDLTATLARLAPPNRSIDAPDFRHIGYQWSSQCSKIKINLSNASFGNFRPAFGAVSQQAGGHFQVALSASDFTANYSWSESWHERFCTSSGMWSSCDDKDHSAGPWGYGPRFGNLAVQIGLAFAYDQATNAYYVKVLNTSASPSKVAPNVPAGSVIQNEDMQCFSSHVSDATANAVSSIDFATPVAALFGPLFKSIPASGHLTPDIAYDFSVGDSGLAFPGDQGLAVGVTGAVTYKGERYAGKPPTVPVPPVPTDANHLRVYVSSYELDALNWAFFRAGLLSYRVEPHDLVDPDVLKVKTYASQIPALKPYQAFAMSAQVTPKQASTTSFQAVWEFTADAVQALQRQLPSNVYQLLGGLDGDNYVAQADLESDLTDVGVDRSWWATIERATRTMGMVVGHDLEFKLTIENGQPNPPNLVFDLVRTDVLQDLSLGVSGTAQTLKYDFKRVAYAAKLVSTTIPKFDKADFGTFIWPTVGEPAYDKLLVDMGRDKGVPLPIMQGFHFLFDHAQLSIQDGYVSVLAQVQFKQ